MFTILNWRIKFKFDKGSMELIIITNFKSFGSGGNSFFLYWQLSFICFCWSTNLEFESCGGLSPEEGLERP